MAGSSSRTIKVKFDGDSTGLASATSGASSTLERFNKSTEETRRGMDRVGDSSENLADSSSLATGALGALASGFELVGLEKYGERLQQAALATDFMSGVGDSLTLVTQKLGLAKAKDALITAKQTVVTKAQTVASKAAAVAQRAVNLAMRANPIGLVITAIVALVAILVIAYKKSETFRKIVDGAFRAVQKAAKFAWDWIKKNWPLLLAIITGPIGMAVYVVARNWDRIKAGAGAAKDFIVGKFDALVSFVRGLPGRISSAAGGMWNGIREAFRSAINWIIGAWNGISFSIPSVNTHIPGVGSVGGFTLSTPNIGYLERGGVARAGRTYVVGEAGPELLSMGSSSGYVTPNHELAGGATEVRVFIGDEELRGMVRTEIRSGNRHTKRRALAGTGANL